MLLELFPFVVLNGFCIDSFLNILKSHIDGISSNLANTFLSSKQILLIEPLELGANAIRVISLCNSLCNS